MAVYSERTKHRTRHEYFMPNPVNAAEFEKALSAAFKDYKDLNGTAYDDSVWVTYSDEEIIIYWEETK